jgi:hypothetical protein
MGGMPLLIHPRPLAPAPTKETAEEQPEASIPLVAACGRSSSVASSVSGREELGSYLCAILDQFAIEGLAIDLQEVGRLGFLPLRPLQREEDIVAFEVRQGAPAHQSGL